VRSRACRTQHGRPDTRPRVAVWALSGFGIAVAAAVAAVATLEVDAWVAAVVAASGTAVAALVPLVVGWVDERKGRRRKLDQLLACALGPVAKVDPYRSLGVTASRIAEEHAAANDRPPYVARGATDARLREALTQEEPLVLLTGPSKSGKSRAMFEAALAVWPQQTLAVPERPRGNAQLLSELFDLEPELGGPPALLWLDDVDVYLKAGALDLRRLAHWREEHPRLIALATMADSAVEPDESAGADRSWIGKDVHEVLDAATTIRLNAELTAAERAEAQRLYPGVDTSAGIGAGLVAGPRLIRRLQAGEQEHPEGVAVALAVADWRRMGFGRPAPRDVVRSVAPRYFRALRGRLPTSGESFEAGVAWATSEIDQLPGVALVFLADEDGLQVHDYVVAYLNGTVGEGASRPIADELWIDVLSHADGAELMSVGYTAYVRGNLDEARRAWTLGADSGDPIEAPKAMVALGVLLEQHFHDYDGARAAFARAAGTGNPEEAPKAMVALGVLLEQHFHDYDGARAAFARAAGTGHSEEAPKANVALGVLLQNRLGDPDGAHSAFERAAESGHPDEAPRAMNANGYLYEQQGRLADARAWYERAGATTHPVEGPRGRENADRLRGG
jgi:tetratricopeptide (TPR) repeat protein